MARRPKRSVQELNDAAAEHLLYEIQMFLEMAKRIPHVTDLIQRNAYLESFLLHARNLRDFLLRDTSRDHDDVLAVDYFDDPSKWKAARTGSIASIKDHRVDKSLMHLSYKRTGIKAPWDYQEIARDVTKLLQKFTEIVEPDRARKLVDWFTTQPEADVEGGASRSTASLSNVVVRNVAPIDAPIEGAGVGGTSCSTASLSNVVVYRNVAPIEGAPTELPKKKADSGEASG